LSKFLALFQWENRPNFTNMTDGTKNAEFFLTFPDAGESIFYGWGRWRRGRAWPGTHADRHERRTTDLFGDVVPPLDAFPGGFPWRRIKTNSDSV
jgi:hypothetical protein